METSDAAQEETYSNISEAVIDNLVEGDDEGELIVDHDAKVIIEKFDRSLHEFHRWYQKGKLIVDPEWQRQYVWDRTRASRLIESFLIDLPIPVVYLSQNDEGNYEVIDGLQRLTSVFDFFEGKYKLQKLEILPELNGLTFGELEDRKQSKLEDSSLRTFELSASTDKDLLFVTFQRLNTGGVRLNEMEIRNCLFRGKLNDLIKELSETPEFVESIDQKNLEKRMQDRFMVLRFLAFYERTYMKAKKGLKKFLNEFFETYQNPSDEKIAEFRKAFKDAASVGRSVFGNRAYRIRKTGARAGEWAPRVNVAVFQTIAVSFTDYSKASLVRASDAILEEYLDLLASDEKWIDAVTASTGSPAKIEYAFDTWNRRLSELMSTIPDNDSVRAFSKELKSELFAQNPTCAICSQEIKLINDAAIDHDIHYWRGGKTIPENARLVHRTCNLNRSHESD